MKKRLREQMDGCPIVTKESLEAAKVKTFHSGREKVIGDKVMYGFLLEETEHAIDDVDPHLSLLFGDESTHIMKQQQLLLITFHPEEFGTLYTLSKMDDGKHTFPQLIKKS